MIIKALPLLYKIKHGQRFFTTSFSGSDLLSTKKWFLNDFLKDNSGTILALGVVGSGTFGVGLYINQMRVYEEKLNTADEKLKAAEAKLIKDIQIAEEKANKEALKLFYNIFTQEEFKDAKKKMLSLRDKS